jgi:hypothetical protein
VHFASLPVRGPISISSHFNIKSFFLSVVFSILEHFRSSLSVSPLQESVSDALPSTCFGARSKPITSLSLHPSRSCPPFNRPKTQDRSEKAGTGRARVYPPFSTKRIPSPRYKAARFKKSTSVIKIWHSCDVCAKLRGGRCFTYISQITVRFSSRI